jgi:2-phosphosulfolactate phosphatase
MTSSHPRAQATYQVRLDWDGEGLDRLAASDLVVVVDVFGASAHAEVAAADGGDPALEPAVRRAIASAGAAEVVFGGVRNAAAVARLLLARQGERGARTSAAIVPLTRDGFAVENQLGAGAVVAALGDLGVDHCSPAAAVAGEGFRALRRALRHLFTASEAGRELTAAGRSAEVLAAAELDASSVVPRVDAGRIVAA